MLRRGAATRHERSPATSARRRPRLRASSLADLYWCGPRFGPGIFTRALGACLCGEGLAGCADLQSVAGDLMPEPLAGFVLLDPVLRDLLAGHDVSFCSGDAVLRRPMTTRWPRGRVWVTAIRLRQRRPGHASREPCSLRARRAPRS